MNFDSSLHENTSILLVVGEQDSNCRTRAERMKVRLDSTGAINHLIIVPELKHELPNDQKTIERILFSFRNKWNMKNSK